MIVNLMRYPLLATAEQGDGACRTMMSGWKLFALEKKTENFTKTFADKLCTTFLLVADDKERCLKGKQTQKGEK